MRDDDLNAVDVAVGRRLSSLRETAGLTRTELAARAGVSLSDMIAYEAGSLRLGAVRMFTICEILTIKPADLLGEIGDGGGTGGRSLHDAGEDFDA